MFLNHTPVRSPGTFPADSPRALPPGALPPPGRQTGGRKMAMAKRKRPRRRGFLHPVGAFSLSTTTREPQG